MKAIISRSTYWERLKSYWSLENVACVNPPLTYYSFLSTGMWEKQYFPDVGFPGWTVLKVYSCGGWCQGRVTSGLSHLRSRVWGCCLFTLSCLWVAFCCIQGLMPGEVCVYPPPPAVISRFLKCLWGFLFMFHFLASPHLSHLFSIFLVSITISECFKYWFFLTQLVYVKLLTLGVGLSFIEMLVISIFP